MFTLKRVIFSILMLAILLILMFLLKFDRVNAQGETSTPTATMTDVPGVMVTQRMTSTPISNVACPTGLPTYWLTKTPSSLWRLNCDRCIIPTLPAMPTVTVTNTGTVTPTPSGTWSSPTPTNTATNTPTPSPTPAKAVECWYDLGCEQLSDTLIRFHKSGTANGWGTFSTTSQFKRLTNANLHIYYVGDLVARNTSSVAGSFQYQPEIRSSVGLRYSTAYFYRLQNVPAGSTNPYDLMFLAYPLNYSGDPAGAIYDAKLKMDYGSWGNAGMSDYWFWDWDYYVFVSVDEMTEFPTGDLPTPTPTPAPSYCSSVNGNEDDEALFDYGGLEFGSKYCMDIGGYQFSILGLDIDIPLWLHICLQNLSFGVVTFFGAKLSLDVLFIAIAVVWGLRLMFA